MDDLTRKQREKAHKRLDAWLDGRLEWTDADFTTYEGAPAIDPLIECDESSNAYICLISDMVRIKPRTVTLYLYESNSGMLRGFDDIHDYPGYRPVLDSDGYHITADLEILEE